MPGLIPLVIAIALLAGAAEAHERKRSRVIILGPPARHLVMPPHKPAIVVPRHGFAAGRGAFRPPHVVPAPRHAGRALHGRGFSGRQFTTPGFGPGFTTARPFFRSR